MINSKFLKENHLENIIYLLIIFIPFTLVSGPFLSDLSVSLITIIFIYLSFKETLFFL